MRIFLFAIVIALFAGCSSNKTAVNTQSNEEFIEKIVKEDFWEKSVEKKFNTSGDLVVLINEIDRGPGFPDVTEFVVLDLKRKKLVYKDSLIDGSVSWKDDDVIILKRIPDAHSKDPEENSNAKYKQVNIREL